MTNDTYENNSHKSFRGKLGEHHALRVGKIF